jgi:FKBP-type peptidyl-prolyl cis-trans isomerase
MKRLVLAAAAALTLSACSPSGAVDANDPWAALQPWNHGRGDVVKLPEGVEYVVVRKGDGKGPMPGPRDMVEVKYEGRIADTGLVFDSSYQRGDTAKFRLNGVIPGWTQGIQKMQPGDQFMFWIPSAQGYGERGSPPKIEPNSDLMFQVELLKVIPDGWANAVADRLLRGPAPPVGP